MRFLSLLVFTLLVSPTSYASSCSASLEGAANKLFPKIDLKLSKESLTNLVLEAYDKLGSEKSDKYFEWWAGRGDLEKKLKKLKITKSAEKNSWERPVLLYPEQLMMMSLVLYKGHLFAGNFFKSNSAVATENTPLGGSTNYHKQTKGQRAIQLLANGKWKLVANGSLRLLELLKDSGTFTLYRGMNRFEFDVSLFIKNSLIDEPNAQVSQAKIEVLLNIINLWKTDVTYNHENNASKFTQFLIWEHFLTNLNLTESLTNKELQKMIYDMFTGEVLTINADGKTKFVSHKMGTFTTPNFDTAFYWAFDAIHKYRTGTVARYNIDLNTLNKNDLKNIYFGIEGDYIEVGFFNFEAKSFLNSSLSSVFLDKKDDPRKSPLWRKEKDQWDEKLNLK